MARVVEVAGISVARLASVSAPRSFPAAREHITGVESGTSRAIAEARVIADVVELAQASS
jgi:hypothetical protein